jgi:hypothetical protein
MNLLLESMTPLQIGPYAVRVWREETRGSKEFQKGDIFRLAHMLSGTSNPERIAEQLIGLPRVNAVEVLDPEKHGVVLYRDWP